MTDAEAAEEHLRAAHEAEAQGRYRYAGLEYALAGEAFEAVPDLEHAAQAYHYAANALDRHAEMLGEGGRIRKH